MESVEFRVSPDGQVFYKEVGKQEKRLTKFSEEIVGTLYQIIQDRFPAAFSRLKTLYPKSNFDVVQRFIRCNFGEHDLLTQDIEHGLLNFEEVHCRMRGMCSHENIICKPSSTTNLTPAEQEVVKYYLNGYTFDKIAELLGKSPSTVKVQLHNIQRKLNARNCREIIKVLRLGNH